MDRRNRIVFKNDLCDGKKAVFFIFNRVLSDKKLSSIGRGSIVVLSD